MTLKQQERIEDKLWKSSKNIDVAAGRVINFRIKLSQCWMLGMILSFDKELRKLCNLKRRQSK